MWILSEDRTDTILVGRFKKSGGNSRLLVAEMKALKIRVMDCDCGLHIDRDQNAAINIRNEGLRLLSEVA